MSKVASASVNYRAKKKCRAEFSKSLGIIFALVFSTTQCSFFLLSCVTTGERVTKEIQGLDSFGGIYQITENDALH